MKLPNKSDGAPRLATAVERSGNKKLGGAHATYAAQRSCPANCALLGAGCYAEGGNMAFTTRRLNRATTAATTPLDVARAEADAIDTLPADRRKRGADLRLHVVGDCPDDQTAQIVSAAAERYQDRSGGRAWTYTHASVDRASWGAVSVLASVESLDGAAEAHDRGYAAALVVSEHPADGRAERLPDGRTLIPCPEQTGRAASCADCRLCLDDSALRDRPSGPAIITFAAHGARANTVRATIAENAI